MSWYIQCIIHNDTSTCTCITIIIIIITCLGLFGGGETEEDDNIDIDIIGDQFSPPDRLDAIDQGINNNND